MERIHRWSQSGRVRRHLTTLIPHIAVAMWGFFYYYLLMLLNKKIYIIPGWRETCRRKQYQNLAKALENKGYTVIYQNIDWDKKISEQVFEVEKNSIVFGFSIGALLARLIAQKYRHKLTIFASMTPLRHFKGGEQEKMLVDAVGEDVVKDIKTHLKSRLKSKGVLLYGDKENEKADIIIKNTDHEISENYIKEVLKLVRQY